MPQLFSVPIFFIIFRETVEAGIIVSVLLSFVEQLMTTGQLAKPSSSSSNAPRLSTDSIDRGVAGSVPSRESTESAALLTSGSRVSGESTPSEADRDRDEARLDPGTAGAGGASGQSERDEVALLVRRMKAQIWAGTLCGLAVATSIGAAFIALFYIKFVDLWSSTEQLWEGGFSLLAAVLIFVMGIAFLRMDRARVKWRYKLSTAFERSRAKILRSQERARARAAGEASASGAGSASQSLRQAEGDVDADADAEVDGEGEGGKWALFILPFVTVLREGLEAVLFVSGVALSVEPAAIPLATLTGLVLGTLVGLAIYRTGSTTTLHYFLIASTSLLFLIGAGLASKGVGFLQYYYFATAVGGDVAETGDGPGSFQVAGNAWHFECCNPEPGSVSTNGFWQLANSLVGWNNTATYATVGVYMGYWLLVAFVLVKLKWKEGRMSFFGMKRTKKSRRGWVALEQSS